MSCDFWICLNLAKCELLALHALFARITHKMGWKQIEMRQEKQRDWAITFEEKKVYLPIKVKNHSIQKFEVYLLTSSKRWYRKKYDKMLRFVWNESLHSFSLVFLLSQCAELRAIFVLLIFSCYFFLNFATISVFTSRNCFLWIRIPLWGSLLNKPFFLALSWHEQKKSLYLPIESTIGNCDKCLRKHFFTLNARGIVLYVFRCEIINVGAKKKLLFENKNIRYVRKLDLNFK